MFGRVASDPTISRLVDVLAAAGPKALTATWQKAFGHHPLVAFVDHGRTRSGEPVATLLRPVNAGSNTASDHIETAQLATAQLPQRLRRGRQHGR